MSQKPQLVNLLKHHFKDIQEGYYLYKQEKYLQAEIIYLKYYNKYPDDPDILHNLACSFFMQKKYELALKYFKKSTDKIWSYHSSYHFISSALYYNKGLLTGDINYFKKSCWFYPQNNQAKNAINGDIANREQIPVMLNINNTAGDLLIFENNRIKFSTSDIYLQNLQQEHFNYHCMAARQFFNRALCFAMLKKNDIAKFDAIRAFEFDVQNPDNESYKNFAETLHLS